MKMVRILGKWVLGFVLLCLMLAILASVRFSIADFPDPNPVRVIFLEN